MVTARVVVLCLIVKGDCLLLRSGFTWFVCALVVTLPPGKCSMFDRAVLLTDSPFAKEVGQFQEKFLQKFGVPVCAVRIPNNRDMSGREAERLIQILLRPQPSPASLS